MNYENERANFTTVDPFFTIKAAATRLGLPYYKVQRFVKSGAVATYRVANGRRLIRLSELVAAIERLSAGGDNV